MEDSFKPIELVATQLQTSSKLDKLLTALAKAQGEMQAAEKNSENPFHKSKYANINAVREAIKPVMAKYDLCVIQLLIRIEKEYICRTILAHGPSDQKIVADTPLILKDKEWTMQGLGSANTYAQRYVLTGFLGIICEENDKADDDGAESSNKTMKDARIQQLEFEVAGLRKQLQFLNNKQANNKAPDPALIEPKTDVVFKYGMEEGNKIRELREMAGMTPETLQKYISETYKKHITAATRNEFEAICGYLSNQKSKKEAVK
jgi:hypothetical protein